MLTSIKSEINPMVVDNGYVQSWYPGWVIMGVSRAPQESQVWAIYRKGQQECNIQGIVPYHFNKSTTDGKHIV